ncbi:response regulator [Mucilaginibacter sp. BJC16-A38]|uniref:response regulator n=1 Tax=Mucilaginibacter phenanthrenivorans TaxID=1234842 RepID=UPI0021574E72|nr:response regulator [Mucilaginibacter phenanthrenivorans]MCR8560386.1 response regulator [Mucilaginibacter phenanthrenivorans]
MFKTILIAEDHESASISVRKTLQDLGVAHTDYAYYCDDALTKIKIALRNQQPFELLVTDLFFEEDQQKQILNGGEALIAAARQLQPGLKILVFSAEHRAAVIDRLFKELHISGYVRKARYDAQELKTAMETLFKNKQHYPSHLRQAVKAMNTHEFTTLDITIISLLSGGIHQKDIPVHLQQKNLHPSGLSSVEKRLGHIKANLGFSKNEQLIAYCKDMGII